VNGTLVGNGPNLSYTFPSDGYYTVTLKVHNGNPSCFASYTDRIKITCGVMSRFYPDKRIIASKAGIMPDSIFFKNRSVGATNYQWMMSNSVGMAEQVVSNDFDLNYVFAEPADYKVRLIAFNGTCADTTVAFAFTVVDPTADGYLNLYAAKCFDQTKVKLTVSICNNGYAAIPPGTPISFYDADPNTGTAIKLDTSFLIPDLIPGSCCSRNYNLEIDVKRIGLNTIYAVFNDSGNSIPLKLPNTSFVEKNYNNNLNSVSGIQFKVTVVPPTASLEPGDSLTLSANSVADTIGSYNWSDAKYLSCTTCPEPLFIAESGGDAKKRLIATSANGCIDSSFTEIKIPTADDFTIKLNEIGCTPGDSLEAAFTICNEFTKGSIPKGLKVSFYNADPSSPTAQLLGPVFEVATNSASCASFTHKFAGTSATNIYAVVNDNGVPPHTLPNDTSIKEKDYTNNNSSLPYTPDKVIIMPADTLVFVNETLPLTITSPVYDLSSVKWLTDPSYTLSCTNCISPVVTVKDSATVKVQMLTMFGCTISGEAKIKIYPPDLQLNITETKCYSNGKTLVKFSLCMNNSYDKIFSGIPVSFYDADPSRAGALLLNNSFKTPAGHLGNCDTFSVVINSPKTGKVFGAVNDKGTGVFPDTAFVETDIANNISNADALAFTVSVSPADTQINKNEEVQLSATVSGGTASSINWTPASNLSCITCLDPVAKPPYTQQYVIAVTNEFSCIATDTSIIETVNEGILSIPNAFTPNGDGLNDIFYIIGGKDILQISDFSIYDRYGQKVFGQKNVPANNPAYGWNGTVKGKPGSIGSYVYAIKLQFADNTTKFYKGTITLIR